MPYTHYKPRRNATTNPHTYVAFGVIEVDDTQVYDLDDGMSRKGGTPGDNPIPSDAMGAKIYCDGGTMRFTATALTTVGVSEGEILNDGDTLYLGKTEKSNGDVTELSNFTCRAETGETPDIYITYTRIS